ncbi:MAG: helix-turn-helix domain-containing protein [Candidatus Zapsychrus exili]|nr:helix-turn-helix domain-containing protein [Candidatus Zapsychrus exili]
MEPEEALKSIGLSSKEIKVYLACLKIGSATVNQISKEAGTFRTYTYDILKSLAEEGLVHHVMKERKQFFESSDPERIIEILKEREDKIKDVLPKLKSMSKSITEKPSVEFYEGLAGVNFIHDLILREVPKEIRVFGNPEQHFEIMKFYLPRFVRTRVKKKIMARVIIKESKIGREWMKGKEKLELRETRFFSLQPKEFPAVIYMWNNKIAYFTIEKKIIAVLIKNENIAQAQRAVFDNLWEVAKKG